MTRRKPSDVPVTNATAYSSVAVELVARWTLGRSTAVTSIDVRKRRDRGVSGRCHQGGAIVVSLPATGWPLKRDIPYRRRGPTYTLADWREALVFVVGHEAAHADQMARGIPADEVIAELAGLAALERFREDRHRIDGALALAERLAARGNEALAELRRFKEAAERLLHQDVPPPRPRKSRRTLGKFSCSNLSCTSGGVTIF